MRDTNEQWTAKLQSLYAKNGQEALLNWVRRRRRREKIKSLTARNQYSIWEFLSCFDLLNSINARKKSTAGVFAEVQTTNLNGVRFSIFFFSFYFISNAHATLLRGISICLCTWAMSMPIESRIKTWANFQGDLLLFVRLKNCIVFFPLNSYKARANFIFESDSVDWYCPSVTIFITMSMIMRDFDCSYNI